MNASRNQLLVSTGTLLLSPLGWVMEAIAEAGFTGAEIVMGLDRETRDPERVRALADATGLTVPVVHGPYMLPLRHVLGVGYVEKTRRAMEVADAIGADTMVAHAPFRFERGAVGWVATEAAGELAAGHTARFGMENLFPFRGRSWSLAVHPEELLAFDHVVFDTSHFAVSGVDLFDAWRLLQDRVVHLHVSDNHGRGRDSHAALGAGKLPITAFLRHVVESGWGGTITLEVDVRAHLDDRETLVRFLRGQREIAEAALGSEPEPAPSLVERT